MVERVKSSSEARLNDLENGALTSRQSKSRQKFNRGKGTSVRHQKMKNASTWLRRHQSRTESPNGSEDLGNIDDAEIAGYLHNEKEMQVKKLLWEIMNNSYLKGRKLKRDRKVKKATPPEKAVKIAGATVAKERLSSKINYDALKKLMGEEQEEIQRKVDESKQPNGYFDDQEPYENSVFEKTHGYSASEEDDILEYNNEDTECSDAYNGPYEESMYCEDEHDNGHEESTCYEDEHDYNASEDFD